MTSTQLSKRQSQSPTTVLFRTTFIRTITLLGRLHIEWKKCLLFTRFRVEYYQDDAGKVGEGEILFIRPRDPRKGEESEVKTWEEFGFNLEPRDWGDSPYLTEEDVDKLTFCCCACCNKKSWLSCLSVALCNKFPNTSTANQFFTPLMFSAYHREGFRACVEANAAEFLKDDRGVLRRNSNHDNIDVWKTLVCTVEYYICTQNKIPLDFINPILRVFTQPVYQDLNMHCHVMVFCCLVLF